MRYSFADGAVLLSTQLNSTSIYGRRC